MIDVPLSAQSSAHRVELRQLARFVVVAEAGHLGRAAERLTMSQPPLARLIQKLEAELGVVLFQRSARGMELTAAGRELLATSNDILDLAEHAAKETRRAGQGQVGQLSLGIAGSAVFGLVPRVLQAFRRNHPGVEIALHHVQAPAPLMALRQGRVHLVFGRLAPAEPDLDVLLVRREPLLLALSLDHALAREPVVDVASLAGETLIVSSSPSTAGNAVALCRAHGFEPRLAPSVCDDITAALLASVGQGVTFVPESMTHVNFPGVAYRPLLSRVPACLDLHCCYLKGVESPLLTAMLETVQGSRDGLAPGGLPAQSLRVG